MKYLILCLLLITINLGITNDNTGYTGTYLLKGDKSTSLNLKMYENDKIEFCFVSVWNKDKSFQLCGRGTMKNKVVKIDEKTPEGERLLLTLNFKDNQIEVSQNDLVSTDTKNTCQFGMPTAPFNGLFIKKNNKISKDFLPCP